MKKILLLALAAMIAPAMFGQSQSADEIISKLKKEIAPDGRTAIWNVSTVMQKGVVTLVGEVDNNAQAEAIGNALKAKGIDYKDYIVRLEDVPAKPWALVKLAIASHRTQGKHSAEMATQSVMGMPVKVLGAESDGWVRVQTPDGYISWVPTNSLKMMCDKCFDQWRKSTRFIVTAMCASLVEEPKEESAVVSDLVLGNILECKEMMTGSKWVKLCTPDGREGYVECKNVEPLSQWVKQPLSMAKIEETAHKMMGAGYLWGGTSTKVTDCSGLVKVCYYSNGVILERDASQQCLNGKYIKGSEWKQAQLGDLLFFGNSETGRITHVGIYLRDGKYIHCSGQVKINSLVKSDPTYLYDAIRISRIEGELGKKGITPVATHPWYF